MKLSENRVVSTRIGLDAQFPSARQFVIDFDGPKLDAIPENDPPQAIANCSTNAVIVDNQVFHNPFDNSWRVMLKMEPKAGNTDAGGYPLHPAKRRGGSKRNMDLSLESALSAA